MFNIKRVIERTLLALLVIALSLILGCANALDDGAMAGEDTSPAEENAPIDFLERYCIQADNEYLVKLEEGIEVGYCRLADGTLCPALDYYYGECPKEEPAPSQDSSCGSDADCVQASCCHSTACTSIDQAPDCKGMMCTMVCIPGTLDCGQGRCVCIDGNCKAEIGDMK